MPPDHNAKIETPEETTGLAPNITTNEILEAANETDFNAVIEVDLHGKGITKLVSFDKFPAIRVLDVSCNALSLCDDLKHQLPQIRELRLYGNRLQKISGLAGLKQLTYLSLQHNQISRIESGLAGLCCLKILRLDSNKLTKIEPTDFNSCISLEILDLSYNYLDSLSALRCASNLKELTAVGNKLSNVDCTGNMQLIDLDLGHNRISDPSGISQLTALRTLNLKNNLISSMKPLGDHKPMLDLVLDNNPLADLNYIRRQFPNLESLSIASCKISSYDHLRFCKHLSDIWVGSDVKKSEILKLVPTLENLDGHPVNAKREDQAPLMRAQTGTGLMTTRHMENQLSSLESNLAESQRSIQATFDSIRDLMNALPLHPPNEDGGSSSRCSSKARITDAQLYASQTY